jgi:hypothetical protein
MTICVWVNRSTPEQSCWVTTPTGLAPSITTAAPCERFVINASTSPTVVDGETVMGVSNTGWAAFTRRMVLATTSSGMSCGMIAIPPRRATVSAILRPDTAVMFATAIGIVVPTSSGVVRSTSPREMTAERAGTMNTSLYVRSYAGVRSLRNLTFPTLLVNLPVVLVPPTRQLRRAHRSSLRVAVRAPRMASPPRRTARHNKIANATPSRTATAVRLSDGRTLGVRTLSAKPSVTVRTTTY